MENTGQIIDAAFADNLQLRKRIFDAINETPQYLSLFHDIADHHLASKHTTVVGTSSADVDGHLSKKRKVEHATSTFGANNERHVILEARDLSFTLPQRKKLHLSIVQYGKSFTDDSTSFALCLRNPTTNEVELEVPTKAFAHAIRVPVPEKVQKQYNFCFLPPSQGGGSESMAPGEGIIWAVNHGPLKSCQINSTELETITGAEDVLEKALDTILQKTGNKLIFPDAAEFSSAIPEAHRKHEKAYHVKAHRGSKDGYLFFLANGIFFGFKKPLAFFPFHEIVSVSYTAVLQRTFNLVITSQADADVEEQEIEFSMIDQADFAGIDAYIKQHQLQDASLAEARRAKQYKVNGKNVEQSDDAEGGSELQKAEAELEDEEDELEEDYDPGSDGDSEGSGTSDDEDGYDEPAKNLVEEELGSEAEDVSDDDQEEEADEQEEVEEEEGDEEEVDEIAEDHLTPVKKAPVVPIHAVGAPDFDDEDQL